MNQQLLEAALALAERARLAGQETSTVPMPDARALVQDSKQVIPQWFADMLSIVPLSGLDFSFGEADEDGLCPHALLWNDARGIRSESFDCYPGLAILQRGYINCASDSTGGGDSYFLGPCAGGDPPVYQVYHDISDDADAILADGLVLVAPRLSELFTNACLEEDAS